MDTTAMYSSSYKKFNMSTGTAAIADQLGKKEIRATILLAVVAFHVPLLLGLSSRQRRSSNRVLRSLHWGVSAAYFPLMTYVLSYLTAYIPSIETADSLQATGLLVLVVLVQFLRAKADMAALAVAAVASPAAGDDDANGLKIRPSAQSFINTFWVAGLVLYNIFSTVLKKPSTSTSPSTSPSPSPSPSHDEQAKFNRDLLITVTALISPLWVLGACRTVVRFAAFQKATGSFALGRNVQLIDGYMLQLREEDGYFAQPQPQPQARQQQLPAVPRLIVTGERNQDVVESPLGYHVKRSSLQGGEGSRLVTLDRVWSSDSDDRRLTDLEQQHKDLCLSFALFKCLRRRFAGYRLAAEAGSASWAFRFVCDGLLGGVLENDHKRAFRVIATELSFASDYFHSPLPVASLGTTAAALHFLFSLIILPSLLLLAVVLLLVLQDYLGYLFDSSITEYIGSHDKDWYRPWVLLALVLTLVIAGIEISEMVNSVRSNWTKISIIGHFVRSRQDGARRFLAWLLRCKTPEFWDDEIRQTQMLKPDLFVVQQPCPCACSRRFRARPRHRHRQLIISDPIEVPDAVKEAILKSLRAGGGQLSDGTEAIRRHAFGNDITWACRDGGGVVTTTDAILVWHIATTLFDMKCRRSDSAAASPPPPPSTTPVANDDSSKSKVIVACCLSRYCMYLVAEAPDLLPDKPAWITRRYEAVKKRIDEAPKCSGDESCVYQHLVDTFSQNSHSHEVLIKGVRLGQQLAEEAEDEVWELLSDFWSEMVLYLAPSDNVKVHIEALQRGGELITLLWALLLHAGITSRPEEFNFTASVLLSTEDPDAIAVENC